MGTYIYIYIYLFIYLLIYLFMYIVYVLYLSNTTCPTHAFFEIWPSRQRMDPWQLPAQYMHKAVHNINKHN